MMNFDCMEIDELTNWAKDHQNPTIKQCVAIFPQRKNVIPIVRLLSQYASNKAEAMTHRSSGNINDALMYERMCDTLYNRLPEFARW